MKNLNRLVLTITLLTSAIGNADCLEIYQQALDATTAVTAADKSNSLTSAETAATTGAILMVGSAFSLGTVVIAGSGAVVAGIKYALQKRRIHNLQNVIALINESYAERDQAETVTNTEEATSHSYRHLAAFSVHSTHDSRALGLSDVATWVRGANENNLLCPVDKNNRLHLYNEKQIFKAFKKVSF